MLRILSLFSGIGAFEKALTNMGVEYEIVNFCEIDKYAAMAYSAIHKVPLEKNMGDITQIDVSQLPKDIDILTYGHPCQSFSYAGNGGGLDDPRRGQLLFNALAIIKAVQPRVAIEENVSALLSSKHKDEFEIMLSTLDQIGYNNHFSIYNAADYGIAQERKRVFTVSVRKDITQQFIKPDPIPLTKSLYDYLEDVVDDHYYINGESERMEKLVASLASKSTTNTIRVGGGEVEM